MVPTIRPIGTLDHCVTLLPSGFRVPLLKVKSACDVTLRIDNYSFELYCVVELGSSRFFRLFSVKVGGKRLIVNFKGFES